MARPLSENKRNAILSAATAVVAAHGTSASTAKIARGAKVAEGSLFTYFDNKDDLLNQLYLELKSELGEAMMRGYPSGAGFRDRCRHVWDRYLEWGARFPAKRKAMRQLAVSDRVTEASRQTGAMPFREVSAMLAAELREGQSAAFASAVIESLAETTLEFMARESAAADRHKRAGFDALWGAIGTT